MVVRVVGDGGGGGGAVGFTMTIEQLRKVWDREPFEPIELYLADGRVIRIRAALSVARLVDPASAS